MEEFIEQSISPCRILKAHRMNRKTVNKETQAWEWTPSETILVTFEGVRIPDYIKLFGLYNVKVHTYVEPIKTCWNCLRYGHSTKFCRGHKVCRDCGQQVTEDRHECPITSQESVCHHCKGDHRTFNQSCPTYLKNKKIKEIMAYDSLGFCEAKELVDQPLDSLKSKHITKQASNPPLFSETTASFPQLKEISLNKQFHFKSFGG
ncbi:uncharacterized protein LOC143342627 [Colletes latitarsis]|uniref:uncharacterized protein LOC143342627 n=1 Tax=Colletes latitarsis TaxID=2605962 RepID=UPI004035C34B